MAEAKSPLINKGRDYWYDNIKAFLIITVVIGHFASGGSGAGFGTGEDWLLLLKKFIYVFHIFSSFRWLHYSTHRSFIQ